MGAQGERAKTLQKIQILEQIYMYLDLHGFIAPMAPEVGVACKKSSFSN